MRMNEAGKQNIYFQFFFWSILFLFVAAKDYEQYNPADLSEVISYDLCHWLFQIIGANFFYFILIRRFFDRRKYLMFSLYFVISVYLISVINRIFTVYVAEPFFADYPKDSLLSIVTDLKYLSFHYAFPIVTGAFVFISVMFMIRYKNEKQNTTQLLKERAELELKSLKAQLNPHFLFNTLNNIYSLSLISSEKTSESIIRLSDILDYILYKGGNKLVPVKDELRIIDDYIELERLRYDTGLQIRKVEKIGFPNMIPPLLYLSLVENAFKHGAGTMSNQVVITIFIETDEERSVFSIENTCVADEKGRDKGIGLSNIEEQLKLQYKNQFSFHILRENNIFKVEVTTPANDN